MWRIVRAELNYHKSIFLPFLGLIPALIVFEMRGPVERIHPMFLIWMLLFLPVNTWVSLRAKDKRELQYMQLPVAAWQIGMARIAVVFAPALTSTAAYALLHVALVPGAPLHLKAFLASTLAVLFLYSIVFIVQDQMVGSRWLKEGKVWIMALLALMVLGNVYLLVITRRARGFRGNPPFFIAVLRYIFRNHPFSTDLSTAVTTCVVLSLAFLSVFSFTRRKTQIA
jgi:hypothetical protein